MIGALAAILPTILAAKQTYDTFKPAPKVPGVPTPQDIDGGAAGTERREYMDEAFPGTTPWERLGSTTGGEAPAQIAATNQYRMQQKEFQQQRLITEMNNRASIIGSSSLGGAEEARSKLAAYFGMPGQPYQPNLHPSQVGLNQANIGSTTAATGQKSAFSDIAQGASKFITPGFNAIGRAAQKFGTAAGKTSANIEYSGKKAIHAFKHHIENRGRRSRNYAP